MVDRVAKEAPPLVATPKQRKNVKRHKKNKLEVKEDQDYYPETPKLVRRGSTQSITSDLEEATNKNKNSRSDIVIGQHNSRLIAKNGHENVKLRDIPEQPWRYICDVMTTMMELNWKYMLTLGLASYFFSWFFFGVLCYVAAYFHGDLPATSEQHNNGRQPCINGVHNFLTMFIYSVGTQTTIGFTEMYPSEECLDTIFLYILQIISSIALEGALVSVIYAKIARPAKQLTKLKFSDKAVICYRDGKLCLMFRVCDFRKQQTIDSKIRVFMFANRHTAESESIKSHTELELLNHGQQIIVWPDVVCHIIDESSPLRHLTNAKQLIAAQFELCVSIMGTSDSTTQVSESRTSYVPCEILWGQRFVNIIDYNFDNEKYVVDYENFNTTISVDMICQE